MQKGRFKSPNLVIPNVKNRKSPLHRKRNKFRGNSFPLTAIFSTSIIFLYDTPLPRGPLGRKHICGFLRKSVSLFCRLFLHCRAVPCNAKQVLPRPGTVRHFYDYDFTTFNWILNAGYMSTLKHDSRRKAIRSVAKLIRL